MSTADDPDPDGPDPDFIQLPRRPRKPKPANVIARERGDDLGEAYSILRKAEAPLGRASRAANSREQKKLIDEATADFHRILDKLGQAVLLP